MKFRCTIIFVLLLAGSQVVLAQSKKKKEVAKEESTNGQPSSLAPYNPEKQKSAEIEKKKTRKPSRKVTYNARDKFYDRMEAVAKENRKAEKELKKPQYSDPSYFGHKRPPKRRPAGKLKYCKECGLRH
jgi:hypothetical protein